MTEETQYQETETPEIPEGVAEPEGEDTDWKAEAAKYKAIAERKAKQLEKVSTSLKEEETKPKKPNTQEGLSRDEVKLYAMGYQDDEVELAVKLANLNGIPLTEAVKDGYFQAKVQERKQKEISAKAQLGPATGGSFAPVKEPDSRDEHQAWYLEEMRKAGLR